MKSWECIEKATNYIEENLESKITIQKLSTIVNLSPFYFQKLFKTLVGKTTMEYIKLRRLAAISEELKINKRDNIIDICLKYGFENHETFSRNFKEAYGMTPSEYRNNCVILAHFPKPSIYLQNNIADEDALIITDGIILEVTRIFLDKPKYFAGYIATAKLEAPAVDPLEDVWNKVHESKANIKGYMPNGNEVGINLNLAKKTNDLKYFAGVEVIEELSDSTLENYKLESRKYVVCKFEAENFNTLITDTIGKVYNYMFLWIRDKKVKVEPIAIELYYGSLPDSSYMELWIPLDEAK